MRSFIEKPAWERVVTDLVNTGIYVLSPEVLRFIPADTPFDFARDLFPRLMASGRGIRGVPMEGYWRDIGDPGSYYRANLDAWEGKLRLPEQRGGALERAPEAFSERRGTPAGCTAARRTARGSCVRSPRDSWKRARISPTG